MSGFLHWGRMLWVLALVAGCALAAHAVEFENPDRGGPLVPLLNGGLEPVRHGLHLPASPKVMLVPINDEATTKSGWIDEWQANFVARRLRSAQQNNFDLVILMIDTRGGEVDACEHINKLTATSTVPVIAYVTGKAFSGGALVSLGCKMIVMAPGTQIGGAKGVSMFGELPDDMRQKLDSSLKATASNLSDENKYPAAITRGMVDSNAEVFEVQGAPQRFITGEELEDLKRAGHEPVILHRWKSKGEILTLSARQAYEVGIAAGIAKDLNEVYTGLSIQPIMAEHVDPSTQEKVARFLDYPIWRVLLVVIGLAGLFMELKAPGHGMGFLAFGFCMGVFFWLQIFAATAGILEVFLFASGVLLVGIELFVFTFGAAGVLGLGLILFSILLSFVPEGIGISNLWNNDANSWEVEILMHSLRWATLTLVMVVVFAILVLIKGSQLPGLSRIALRTASSATAFSQTDAQNHTNGLPSISPLQALVGQAGIAETVLRPSGKVRLGESTYDAESEGHFLEPGTAVVVMRVSGQALIVRKA